MDSSIVDIGCGCGRFAHVLRDTTFLGHRYSGSYLGIDIDKEMLRWCAENFDGERFEFVHSTHDSKSYVNDVPKTAYVSLPRDTGSVDFVFSTSLFSHLLERELKNYIDEASRILKPEGVMMMSVFCLDYPPPTYGSRHTFQHRIGNAHVESLAQPEAAVAYSAEFLLSLCSEAGFSRTEIVTAPGLWQPRLIAYK